MMTDELETARKIATKAGRIMRHYFYSDQEIKTKPDGTPVTIADTTINHMVIEELAKAFPADDVIGEEESTGEYGMGRKWFCDPIDGTKAYTWGVPTAMFSLALVIDGRPVIGVAYDPFLDEMFWAIKGEGSYRNTIKLQVNNHKLTDGILAIASSPSEIRERLRFIDGFVRSQRLATYSGAVHKASRVAQGNFVGYIERHVGAHDMAAVDLIVHEAGGTVTDYDGKLLDYRRPFRGAVVSNSVAQEELLTLLRTFLDKK